MYVLKKCNFKHPSPSKEYARVYMEMKKCASVQKRYKTFPAYETQSMHTRSIFSHTHTHMYVYVHIHMQACDCKCRLVGRLASSSAFLCSGQLHSLIRHRISFRHVLGLYGLAEAEECSELSQHNITVRTEHQRTSAKKSEMRNATMNNCLTTTTVTAARWVSEVEVEDEDGAKSQLLGCLKCSTQLAGAAQALSAISSAHNEIASNNNYCGICGTCVWWSIESLYIVFFAY